MLDISEGVHVNLKIHMQIRPVQKGLTIAIVIPTFINLKQISACRVPNMANSNPSTNASVQKPTSCTATPHLMGEKVTTPYPNDTLITAGTHGRRTPAMIIAV